MPTAPETLPSDLNVPIDENTISALENAFQDDIINSVDDKPTRSLRLSGILVVVGVLIASVATIGYVMSVTQSTETIESSGSGLSSGVFRPETLEQRQRNLTGKIYKSNEADTAKYFVLFNAENKAVAYLESDKNDLSLSEGMNVRLEGVATGQFFNNIEVVQVAKVYFK